MGTVYAYKKFGRPRAPCYDCGGKRLENKPLRGRRFEKVVPLCVDCKKNHMPVNRAGKPYRGGSFPRLRASPGSELERMFSEIDESRRRINGEQSDDGVAA